MRKIKAPKDEGLNWFDSSNPKSWFDLLSDGEMLQSFSNGLFIKQIW